MREPFADAASGCATMVLSSVGAVTDDNHAWLSLRMHCNRQGVLYSLLHTALACCYGGHATASRTDYSGASHSLLDAAVGLPCRRSYCRPLRSSLLPLSRPFCCSLELKCYLRWLLVVCERTLPLLLSERCC